MRLDLTLLPLKTSRDLNETLVFVSDQLSFDRDYEIFGQIIEIGDTIPIVSVEPLPTQLGIRIEGIGVLNIIRCDKYGEELTFAYALHLKKLVMPKNTTQKNKAIKAFIDALPDDTPIILYWH